MDLTTGNDCYPEGDPIPETDAICPHMQDEPHGSEPTGEEQRLDLSLRGIDGLAPVSAKREAKIRALQDAIKNRTYHVPAEQIAEKMLRCTLEEELA